MSRNMAWPAGVRKARLLRRSVGSASRLTMPRPSSRVSTLDADFLCERDLVHSGVRQQNLHHAGLNRCRAEALAVLEVDGDIDLVQSPHQEARSSE